MKNYFRFFQRASAFVLIGGLVLAGSFFVYKIWSFSAIKFGAREDEQITALPLPTSSIIAVEIADTPVPSFTPVPPEVIPRTTIKKNSPTTTSKPTPSATIRPTPRPTPSPTPTDFDLNLESILLSTDTDVAKIWWDGIFNAVTKSDWLLPRRYGIYATTVIARNNGRDPVFNVKYTVIADDKTHEVIKDRIDQGTSFAIRVTELPDDDKPHHVRVTVDSGRPESNPNNNAYEFTYRIE